MLSQILPVLKIPVAAVPNEQKRFERGQFADSPVPRREKAPMYPDFVGLADKLARGCSVPQTKPVERKPLTNHENHDHAEAKKNVSGGLRGYLADLLERFGPDSDD